MEYYDPIAQSEQEDEEEGEVPGEHQEGAQEEEEKGQGAPVQLLSSSPHPRSPGHFCLPPIL